MQKFSIESSGRADLYGDDDDGHLYLVKDVDAALASKDRDLADANHALLLANNNAAAFQRVAEAAQNSLRSMMLQARWLRQIADNMDSTKISATWANTCRAAADAIERAQPTTGASNEP